MFGVPDICFLSVCISFFIFCVCVTSDTAYVRVFISDVNDNKPAFAQASYEVDVDEDADVGFAILTVSANDGDEGGWRGRQCGRVWIWKAGTVDSKFHQYAAAVSLFSVAPNTLFYSSALFDPRLKRRQAEMCDLKSASVQAAVYNNLFQRSREKAAGCLVVYLCNWTFYEWFMLLFSRGLSQPLWICSFILCTKGMLFDMTTISFFKRIPKVKRTDL